MRLAAKNGCVGLKQNQGKSFATKFLAKLDNMKPKTDSISGMHLDNTNAMHGESVSQLLHQNPVPHPSVGGGDSKLSTYSTTPALYNMAASVYHPPKPPAPIIQGLSYTYRPPMEQQSVSNTAPNPQPTAYNAHHFHSIHDKQMTPTA